MIMIHLSVWVNETATAGGHLVNSNTGCINSAARRLVNLWQFTFYDGMMYLYSIVCVLTISVEYPQMDMCMQKQ
jgi:hypothetical protein